MNPKQKSKKQTKTLITETRTFPSKDQKTLKTLLLTYKNSLTTSFANTSFRVQEKNVPDRAIITSSEARCKELEKLLTAKGFKKVSARELKQAKEVTLNDSSSQGFEKRFCVYNTKLGCNIAIEANPNIVKELVNQGFKRHAYMYKEFRNQYFTNLKLVAIDGENLINPDKPTMYGLCFETHDNSLEIKIYTTLPVNAQEFKELFNKKIFEIKKEIKAKGLKGLMPEKVIASTVHVDTEQDLLEQTKKSLEELILTYHSNLALTAHKAEHDLVVIPSMIPNGREIFTIHGFKFKKEASVPHKPVVGVPIIIDFVNIPIPVWNHKQYEVFKFLTNLDFKEFEKELTYQDLQELQQQALNNDDSKATSIVAAYNAMDVLRQYLMVKPIERVATLFLNASRSRTCFMTSTATLSKNLWQCIALERYRSMFKPSKNLEKQVDNFFETKKELVEQILTEKASFQPYSGIARVLYPFIGFIAKHVVDNPRAINSYSEIEAKKARLLPKLYKEIVNLSRQDPHLATLFARFFESLNAIPILEVLNLKAKHGIDYVNKSNELLEKIVEHYWYTNFTDINNLFEEFKYGLEILKPVSKGIVNIANFFMYLKQDFYNERKQEIEKLVDKGILIDLGFANIVSVKPGSVVSQFLKPFQARHYKEGFEISKNLTSRMRLEQLAITNVLKAYFASFGYELPQNQDKQLSIAKQQVLEEARQLINYLHESVLNLREDIAIEFSWKSKIYTGKQSWIRLGIENDLQPGQVYKAYVTELGLELAKQGVKPSFNACFKKLFGFDLQGKGCLSRGTLGKLLYSIFYDNTSVVKRELLDYANGFYRLF